MSEEKYTVKVHADTQPAESKVSELKRSIEGSETTLKISASVTGTAKLQKFTQELDKLKNKNQITVDVKVNAASIHNQIQNAINKSLKNANYSGTGTNTGTGSTSNQTKQLENELKKQAKLVETYKSKISNGLFDVDNSNIQSKLDKYSSSQVTERYKKIQDMYTNLKKLQTELNNSSNLSDKDYLSKYKEYQNALEKISNEFKVLKNEASSIPDPFDQMSGSIAANKIGVFLKENTKLTKEYREELELLQQKLANTTDKNEYNALNKQAQNLMSKARSEGLTGKSLFSEIKQQASKLTQFVSVYSIISKIPQIASSAAQEVLSVDTAMTDLRKVTSATDTEVTNYFKTATENAKELGTTISDAIEATANFSKLGYNLEESNSLARYAQLYMNVGDNMTIDEASQSITSTLMGFQLDVEDVSHIIDSFNEVSNNFAISSDGIGTSLQSAASSLNLAGASLEESIGMITAANTVVQDPSKVGNGLRTIALRLQGATTELEELGEDTEGMATTTAKARKELMALTGVDIMETETDMKDLYQIMSEIADKWGSLNDLQKMGVTELAAGKNRANIFTSMMDNWDIAEEATLTALNSQGSAARENARFMESLQAKIQQFQAAWQGLANTSLDSDFLKNAVDTGTNFLEILTEIIDKFGLFKSAFGLVGGALAQRTGSGKIIVVFNAPFYKVA